MHRICQLVPVALLLVVCDSSLAARPAKLLADFGKTQLIIDTNGRGCVLFDVYVAQTNEQRQQGLMFIEQMGDYEGMLFPYATPTEISMWMKNTLIALDMLFVDTSWKIKGYHENAVPLSETVISSGGPAAAVIELNAGAVQRFNMEIGKQVYIENF